MSATRDDDWVNQLLDTVSYGQDVDRRVAARLQIKRAVLTPDLRLRTALAEVRAIHTKKAKAANFDDCGCDYCLALEPFESDAALSDQNGMREG